MTPADHAATARTAIAGVTDRQAGLDAVAALVALAERATELERRLLECNDSFDLVEARATELERERDELRQRCDKIVLETIPDIAAKLKEQHERAEQLERELAETRELYVNRERTLVDRAEQLEQALRAMDELIAELCTNQSDESDYVYCLRSSRERAEAALSAALDGGTATPTDDRLRAAHRRLGVSYGGTATPEEKP